MPNDLPAGDPHIAENDTTALAVLGYCPHCDYALLAAGVCPECGKSIDPSRIRKRPRSVRTRRAALFVCLSVLLVGGAFLAKSGLWHAWVPTSFLIRMQPASGWTSEEIFRRIDAGTLTESQKHEFLEQALPIRFGVRSPHPQAYPLFLMELNDTGRSTGRLSSDVEQLVQIHEIRIDGERVAKRHVPTSYIKTEFKRSVRKFALRFDPLEVGAHELKIRYTVVATIGGGGGMRSNRGFPMQYSATITQAFEVKPKLAADALKPQYDQDLAESVRNRIRITASRVISQNRVLLVWCCDGLPVPVSGSLRVFDDQTDTLLWETENFIQTNEVATRRGEFHLPDSMTELSEIRVILTADPDLAYLSGDARFFGGELEWPHLEIDPMAEDEDALLIRASGCPARFGATADVVRKWTAEGAGDSDGNR